MTAFRKASGRWAAHIALLLLLVQLFANGFTSASHAAAPQVDAFGNVLCLAGEPGEPQDGHHAVPDCCSLGCNQSLAHPSSPADDTAVSLKAPAPAVAMFIAAEPGSGAGRLTRPGSPRAPPLSV